MVYFPRGYALTDKQKLFCDEYLNTLDGYKAAKLAGYSEQRALAHENTIMQLPKVKEYINLHISEAKQRQEAKQDQSVDRLQRNLSKLDYIIDKTISDNASYLDKDGNEVVKVSQLDTGMRAIDLQAKIYGHYAPVKSANLNVNVNKEEVTEAKALLHRLTSEHTKDH